MKNQLIFESFDEYAKYLDENLPRDLADVYKNRTLVHEPLRHPESDHSLLKRRRSVLYDYGKSKYEELTPEEALAYVKEDKYNVENLRLIVKGNLVEFEVRPNGTIYPVYGSDDHYVNIGGKIYKNVRYASFRTLILNADKIYKTDEYEHPISDDELEKRETSYTYNNVGGFPDDDPSLLAHSTNKFQKFYADSSNLKISPELLDTGEHDIRRRYMMPTPTSTKRHTYKDANSYLGTTNSRLSAHSGASTVGEKLSELIDALGLKLNVYKKYDRVRKALKKLEREKADYQDDPEDQKEYENLKARWTKEKIRGKNYIDDTSKQVLKIKDNLLTDIGKKELLINNTIAKYLQETQKLLDRAHKLGERLQIVSNTSIYPYTSKDINNFTYDSDLWDTDLGGQEEFEDADKNKDDLNWWQVSRRMSSTSSHLLQTINMLEANEKKLQNYRQQLASQTDNIADTLNNVDNVLSEDDINDLENSINVDCSNIETNHEDLLHFKFNNIKKFEKVLDNLQTQLDELRPITATKKAQKAAKNKKAELDPSIANLVTFGEFD